MTIRVQNHRNKDINSQVIRNYIKIHGLNATHYKKPKKAVWFVTKNDSKITYCIRLYKENNRTIYEIRNCITKNSMLFHHATYALEYLLNNLV